MLEDDFNDVLGKAIRGLAKSASELAIPESSLQRLLAGEMDQAAVRKIAPLLDLDAEKLIRLEHYSPKATAPACLHTFVSSFGHLGVNAFIVETAEQLLVFDTGTDSEDLFAFIAQHPDKQAILYITHDHPDHTAGIHQFKQRGVSVILPEKAQDQLYAELSMTCLNVDGHCSPATAYLLQSEHLDQPICIVGDAIFAGSVGGCKSKSAYQMALPKISQNLLSLPAETILCSGHGPLTTVAQELENNPFF